MRPSGVNMLWAGLLLTLMGCVLFRFNTIKVMMRSRVVVLAIVCNVLRATSLFHVEAALPHARRGGIGIGIAAFTMSAAATLWLLTRLRREAVPCASCARAETAVPCCRGRCRSAGSLRHPPQRRRGECAVSGWLTQHMKAAHWSNCR
jgi:hypothetical protein